MTASPLPATPPLANPAAQPEAGQPAQPFAQQIGQHLAALAAADPRLTPALLTPAQQAAQAHQALALPVDSAALVAAWQLPDPQAPALSSAQGQAYVSAKLVALALGFVAHDAQVLARAWAQQSLRTAAFDPLHWPQAAADFGLLPAQSEPAFAPCPELGLYAVLPDAAWCARMAAAGVPTVQLRYKSDDRQAIAREVQAAVRAVQGSATRLFINDHWQAAIEAGAYGVHLGQEDMLQAPLRQIRQAGLRLGLSTHGYAEMLAAAAHQPSYLALGAIYPTTLKRMATAPQGPARLRQYAQLMRHMRLVAIGGIDEARLPEVLASGVGSVAMVRQLVSSPQPERVAQLLMAAIDAARTPKTA